MKTKFSSVVAQSTELDSLTAVNELIKKCDFQLGNQKPKAGIIYAGIDVDHQLVVNKLCDKWPDLELIGCTTDGEYSSDGGYAEDSLVLTLFISEEIEIVSGFIDNTATNLSEECSRAFIETTNRMKKAPILCILLSDVLQVNGESVMEGLSKASGDKIVIIGGMSADSWRFNQSKQFFKSTVSTKLSAFLLFSGPLDFSFGIDSGWESIGEMGTVTLSKGNVIYEINHMPALEFYKDILGEHAVPTLELPIAIYDENGSFCFLRTSFENYNSETGAITYLGNVPMNYSVRITIVNRESILAGAASAIGQAFNEFPKNVKPSLALCFSCSARRVLLGTRTVEEYQMIRGKLGEKFQVAGFYTYGEICPTSRTIIIKFHKVTFLALLIG